MKLFSGKNQKDFERKISVGDINVTSASIGGCRGWSGLAEKKECLSMGVGRGWAGAHALPVSISPRAAIVDNERLAYATDGTH